MNDVDVIILALLGIAGAAAYNELDSIRGMEIEPRPEGKPGPVEGRLYMERNGSRVYKPVDGPVTPHGAFEFLRKSGKKHLGVDLEAKGAVVAPEDAEVVYAGKADNPPWRGYGPEIVVLKSSSGRYHLLGHLSSVTVKQGETVTAGQPVGRVGEGKGAIGHVHWEVRNTPFGGKGAWRADPLRWFETGVMALA